MTANLSAEKPNKRKQSENLLAGAPKFPLLRALGNRGCHDE